MRDESAGERQLAAARVLGAAVLADLALLATHMPEGYMGAVEELTRLGAVFVGLQLALTALALAALLRGRPSGRRLAFAVLALDVGFFVLPVLADPVAAGALVAWQVAILVRMTSRGPAASAAKPADWIGRHGPALRHLLAVSLAAWVAALGFRVVAHPLAVGLCVLLSAPALAASVPFLGALWRAGSRWSLLPPLLALGWAAASIGSPGRVLIGVAACEALLLVMLLARMPIHAPFAARFARRPPALVVGTFALLIVVGTVLLSFPAATAGSSPLAPVDALFTAASAACVTGLTVVDTQADLTFFGQVVVLVLIQAGGLGILVLSGFAATLFGEGLGLRGERALGESLDLTAGGAIRLVRFLVASTLALEAAGAAVLAVAFAGSGMSASAAVWHGVFHSVSAYCNAGFALWSDSLYAFRSDPAVLLAIAALVTAGGLGFPVLVAGWASLRGQRNTFSTHARIVVVASGALTVLGAFGYAAGEWSRSLAGLGTGDKLLGALFQSVTLRTAGFNAADLASVAPVTFLWMLVLMFIGASPGGTGGGVKTTTAAVLATAVRAAARGEERAVLHRRTVPLDTVYRAASIATLTLAAILVALSALLLTQPLPFDRLLFETVSAVGTVGLSLGATPELDSFGKLVIAGAMLLGRVGPLTLALLFRPRRPGRLRYPEARIMVG